MTDSTTVDSYVASDGPARFTRYTLVLNAISVVMVSLFVWFLPRTKQECHEWKDLGEQLGTSTTRGRITLAMVTVVIVVRHLNSHFLCLLFLAPLTQVFSCFLVRHYRGYSASER